jgi:hypothetical protein
MSLLIKMHYLKLLRGFLSCFLLLLAACAPKADEPEKGKGLEPKDSKVDASSFEGEVAGIDTEVTSGNPIDSAIARYKITLSEDEKAAILEPLKKSFSGRPEADHLKDLRNKIESMIDLREAQLKGDPNFKILLSEHLGNSFTKAEWEGTVSNIPDLNALNATRQKLDEQFPASPEEAIMQAQDALFQKALSQKLRDEVTKDIVVSTSEVNEFLIKYKANSNVHVLYLAKYRDIETAALELKRDEFWNTWLDSQDN